MKRAKNIKDLTCNNPNAYVISASDIHIPFQDDKAVKAFVSYIKKKQPDVIVLNGDIMDFFRLSRFAKGEGRNPYQEIVMCRKLLKTIRDACPNATIYYTLGNHETRLEKYILEKAPELEAIIEDIFSILKVQEFDVYGCASLTLNNTFVFKHGRLLGKRAGMSAMKEIENAYMSGCSGHTHRLVKFITRKSGKKFVWFESGCLCTLEPEYMIDPDWQQGFVEMKFKSGRVQRSKVIEIEDGEIQD